MGEDLVLLDRGRSIIRTCTCFLQSYLRDEDGDTDSDNDEVDDEVDGLLFRHCYPDIECCWCCSIGPLCISYCAHVVHARPEFRCKL